MLGGCISQTRDVAITDERRLQFAIAVFVRSRNSEIKDTHAIARFASIDSAVACAHHLPLAGFLFPAEINHRVSDRRVAIDRVGASPKEQIARLQIFQLEGVVFSTENGLEFSGASQPDVLLTGIARDIGHAVLPQHEINESGAIHSTVCRIVRTVFVSEITSGELERGAKKLLHALGIGVETFNCLRRKRRVRSSALW